MALATLFLAPWMLLGRLVELVRTTLSPSTFVHSKLMMVSKYVSVHISSIAMLTYEQEMLENQCPSEVEKKSESGLPTGQRCIVGYWRVPTAAEAMLRQHTYTNIIDRSGANRSSQQSGPILYYPLGWNLSSESIQKKTNWNRSLSHIKRHSCPRDFYNLLLHLSEILSFLHFFLYCLLGLPKFDTI